MTNKEMQDHLDSICRRDKRLSLEQGPLWNPGIIQIFDTSDNNRIKRATVYGPIIDDQKGKVLHTGIMGTVYPEFTIMDFKNGRTVPDTPGFEHCNNYSNAEEKYISLLHEFGHFYSDFEKPSWLIRDLSERLLMEVMAWEWAAKELANDDIWIRNCDMVEQCVLSYTGELTKAQVAKVFDIVDSRRVR